MDFQFDTHKVIEEIGRFLSSALSKSRLQGYVVGLSGGIDSSLAAALAVLAVGRDKVYGVSMPFRTSSPDSSSDAKTVAKVLGIEYKTLEISPMIDAYFDKIDNTNRVRAGNKMARERMAILFDIAHQRQALVLGTGNRTEICLGYTTWYGDSACSLNPIGQLYKSEVRQLAAAMNIPQAIIDKPPSADLWEGQTDESEIGVSYEQIDRLLKQMVDEKEISRSALSQSGLEASKIERVTSLLNANYFKRELPAIADIGRGPVPQSIELTD